MAENNDKNEVTGNDVNTSPKNEAANTPAPTAPPAPAAAKAPKTGVTLSPVAMIGIGAVLAVGVLGGAFGIYSAMNKPEPIPVVDSDLPPGFEDGVLLNTSPEDLAAIEKALQDQVQQDSIRVSMTSTPTYPSGKEKGVVLIANKPPNASPFIVEFILEDGRSVYKSGLIPVNSYLEEAKLSENLPKGNYPGSAIFTVYSEDGKVKGGSVGVAIEIIVQS